MVKILKKTTFKEFFAVNELVANTSPMRFHYNSSNPFERWLWEKKKKVIRHLLQNLDIKNIIDLGCGDGGLIELVEKKISYTGIDISPTQVKYTKEYIKRIERKNATVYVGDLMNLKIKDNKFDSALVCDVVEHVLSPQKLLNEVKRVVKNRGYIIFSIPNETLLQLARAASLRFPIRSPDHINEVYPDDIRKNFTTILKEIFIPVSFSPKLSLIHIFLVKNVK